MSMHFSANQFEQEYKASKLRNWEIPRWHPERPCGNRGKTKVVSNEKGHLLPGVQRSFTNPWGNFVGTWDLPKKISREEAFKLSAPTLDKIQKWRGHCQKQGCPPPPIPQITTSSKKSREAIAKQEALTRQEAAAVKKRAKVESQETDETAVTIERSKQKEGAPKSQHGQDMDSEEFNKLPEHLPCPIHDTAY